MAKIQYKNVTLKKAREILQKEIIGIVGYGIQGRTQSLNLRENGFHVIVGQRKSASFAKAQKDGWVSGKNLFSIEEVLKKSTIICFLVSDSAQITLWPIIKKFLTPGKMLCFAHGFALSFQNQTHIVPPKNIDVVLIAPRGSGRTFRQEFLKGNGILASYNIYHDATKKALGKTFALARAIGVGNIFPTTVEKETHADLIGERGVLVGAMAGLFEAQYELLRRHGYNPIDAFCETVEEATQSLVPLIGENGMDWLYTNISATAQRGALDWKPKFKKALIPVFEKLYKSVVTGREAKIILTAQKSPKYPKKLKKELDEIRNNEMSKVGKKIRSLRGMA